MTGQAPEGACRCQERAGDIESLHGQVLDLACDPGVGAFRLSCPGCCARVAADGEPLAGGGAVYITLGGLCPTRVSVAGCEHDPASGDGGEPCDCDRWLTATPLAHIGVFAEVQAALTAWRAAQDAAGLTHTPSGATVAARHQPYQIRAVATEVGVLRESWNGQLRARLAAVLGAETTTARREELIRLAAEAIAWALEQPTGGEG